MRAAVILAAIAIKIYLWLRIVPRGLMICGVYLLIVVVTCAVFYFAVRIDKPKYRGGPFCESAEPDYDAFRSCEFRLRDARLGNSSLTRF